MARKDDRFIYVGLSRELHKALKLRAARDETTVKALVVEALERLLTPRKEV